MCSGQTFTAWPWEIYFPLSAANTHITTKFYLEVGWHRKAKSIFGSWILFPLHLSPRPSSPQIFWHQIPSYHFPSIFSSLLKIKQLEAMAKGASLFPEWPNLIHLPTLCLAAFWRHCAVTARLPEWFHVSRSKSVFPGHGFDPWYVDLPAPNTTLLLGRLETFQHW